MKNQSGFSHVFIVVVIIVIAAVGLAAYNVINKNSETDIAQSVEEVERQRQQIAEANNKPQNQQKNSAQTSCGTAPVIALPVDKSRIKSVLYPGQVRGNNFKPHGGFILTGDNNAEVKLPLSGKVTQGVRYYEMGELQYMFDFEADCGYQFRLDHLHTLTSELQEIANQLPAPTQDSATTKVASTKFEAGTTVATKVGFVKTGNTSFDFGFYNMNSQNEASKDPGWPQDFQYQSQLAKQGTCWFDYLSRSDEQLVRSLPAGDANQGKNSVYCK